MRNRDEVIILLPKCCVRASRSEGTWERMLPSTVSRAAEEGGEEWEAKESEISQEPVLSFSENPEGCQRKPTWTGSKAHSWLFDGDHTNKTVCS